MRHEISYRPTFAQLSVSLDRGEAVRAEAGAMLSHTAGIDVRTGTDGGLLGSLKRSVFGGESFFLNTFEAREPGSVTFAPRLPGDVIERDLGYEPLFVQSSSFLAGTPSVDLDTKFGGFRTFFAGEGLFLLRLAGPGSAFLSSFGAIDEVPLAAGERVVVDTGHVVAFEASVDYSVRRVGGLRSTLLSGEGLVVEFEGPGTVWTQSRSPDAFLDWIVSNVPHGGAVVPVGDVGPGSSSAGVGGGGGSGEAARQGGGQPPGSGPAAGRGRANGGKSGPESPKRRGSTFEVTRGGGRGRSGSRGAGGRNATDGGAGKAGAGRNRNGRASGVNGGSSSGGDSKGGSTGPSRRSGGKRS
nr:MULTISPECIES: TIGR00266 family protein [Halorussus]